MDIEAKQITSFKNLKEPVYYEEFRQLLLSFYPDEKEALETHQRLYDHFGSFSSILEADITDIERMVNYNKRLARLLSSIPKLAECYYEDKLGGGRKFGSMEAMVEFCMYKTSKDIRESYSVLMLDRNMRMLGIEKLAEGDYCELGVSFEALASTVFRYGAVSYVIVHNHPGRTEGPSDGDMAVTERIHSLMLPFGKSLVEHFIIAGNKYYPIMQAMRNNGFEFYTY